MLDQQLSRRHNLMFGHRLLPEILPIHPHRWWIQTRIVFIPMSYLYGIKFKATANDLVQSLREVGDTFFLKCLLMLRKELYVENYYKIYWPAQRNNICPADLYAPHTRLFDLLNVLLGAYECCTVPPIRRKAIQRAYELCVFEDENTAYQGIAPVSKMMNLIVRMHADGPGSEAYKMHDLRRLDFMWLGADGMMTTGTNGSQSWDLAFIAQALVETGLATLPENQESLAKALVWLDGGQIRENPKHFEACYRHRTKGAWGFSTKEQGYTVSDCTGEGLKTALYLQSLP
jgi:lanosterol synthase